MARARVRARVRVIITTFAVLPAVSSGARAIGRVAHEGHREICLSHTRMVRLRVRVKGLGFRV